MNEEMERLKEKKLLLEKQQTSFEELGRIIRDAKKEATVRVIEDVKNFIRKDYLRRYGTENGFQYEYGSQIEFLDEYGKEKE